jgi:small subunit ribosomal protein S1
MSESFAELFENNPESQQLRLGAVILGTIVSLNRQKVIVSVGLKSEGFIPLSEFLNSQGIPGVEEGDIVEVVLKSIDDGLGNTLLSYADAKHLRSWQTLQDDMESKQQVTGMVTGIVRGGLTLDINGVNAFLPGSLVDIVPIRDFNHLLDQEMTVIIVKMDKARNNIVVSRKAVLQEANSVNVDELLSTLEPGKEISGIVKNLANYGAFVDLGGIDGLLHITDISWQRINHPSEKLTIGDKITVKVLSYDKSKKRVSLGLKQLTSSPWDGIATRLPSGTRVSGVISNLTDYGAFLRIEPGIEGLVHVSEMDWNNSTPHPAKIFKPGQQVDAIVLEIQETKHRISLSIKQAQENPYSVFNTNHIKGEKISVTIKSITDFGLFVELPGSITGLVHVTDISLASSSKDLPTHYTKGQELDVVILDINTTKHRVSLGIKQLTKSESYQDNYSSNPPSPTFADILRPPK